MRKIIGFWFCLFMFCLLLSVSSTLLLGLENDGEKLQQKVPRVTSKLKINGVLEEKEWEGALVVTLNYEVDPGENIAAPVKTEVFLAYDSKHLRVAFRAYDPNPSEIRAHVTDRDNISNDDYVGIILDTFNDSRLTHNLYCNPLGIQYDKMNSLSSGGILWDAIWDSAGRITPDGYVVEMAIPFNSLRFQGKKGDQVWGIDLVRSYPRSISHMIGLFPRDRNNNCYMCQAVRVEGFSGTRAGKNIELDPTLSGILTQQRSDFPDGDYIDLNKKVEAGLTARWSFTPNLTLSAAVNPDFSQVEADTAQLEINKQFALYYPERRPFFLEGSSIFSARFRAVYTRTIANPEWGIKLTGKDGKNAIGFFSARDTITNLILPSSQSSRLTSLDMKNVSTAFRFRRDMGSSSSIGVLITDREGKDYYSRVFGVDGDVRFTKKDTISFQYLASQTRYPDDFAVKYGQSSGRFSGGAFDAYYTHNSRNVYLFGQYVTVTPNFRADVGFIGRTDYKDIEAGGNYTWRKNEAQWFSTITVGTGVSYMTDFDEKVLLKGIQFYLVYNGPLQSYLFVAPNFGKRAYLGNEFDDNYLECTLQVRPSGSLTSGVSGVFGDRIDFSNVRPGNVVSINPFVGYRMGRHFTLDLDHLYETLNVDGGRLYTANLTNLAMTYQVNRRVFLRAILQYADYNYNPELYLSDIDPKSNHLFSQFLFSYKINPQTVLFLGYSDDYYGFTGIPLTRNNRTLFMKIGYALVL